MYSMSFGEFGVWSKSKEMKRNVIHSPHFYSEHSWRRALRDAVVAKAKKEKGYARKHRKLVLSAAQAKKVDLDFGDGTWVSDYERYYIGNREKNPKVSGDAPMLTPEGLKRVGARIVKGEASIDFLDKDLAATVLHQYILAYERQQEAAAAEAAKISTPALMLRKPIVATVAPILRAPGTTPPTPGEMTPEEQAMLMMLMQQQAAAAEAEAKVDWVPWAVGGGAVLLGVGVAAALIIRKRRKARDA